jgi:hypothetical protein
MRRRRSFRDRKFVYNAIRFMDAEGQGLAKDAVRLFKNVANWVKSKLSDYPSLKKALVIILKLQGIAAGLATGAYLTAASLNTASLIVNRNNEALKGELKAVGLWGIAAPIVSAAVIALDGAIRWKLAKFLEEEKQESLERR